uniref:Uncharacterized protein n=1 Tax=Armadillidium vulgare clopovirus TaxID=2984284 RepID=A0A9C7CET6_9VIRU|nr:MAG: hypothetical protein [Armadillidium vulgare clopovirus]
MIFVKNILIFFFILFYQPIIANQAYYHCVNFPTTEKDSFILNLRYASEAGLFFTKLHNESCKSFPNITFLPTYAEKKNACVFLKSEDYYSRGFSDGSNSKTYFTQPLISLKFESNIISNNNNNNNNQRIKVKFYHDTVQNNTFALINFIKSPEFITINPSEKKIREYSFDSSKKAFCGFGIISQCVSLCYIVLSNKNETSTTSTEMTTRMKEFSNSITTKDSKSIVEKYKSNIIDINNIINNDDETNNNNDDDKYNNDDIDQKFDNGYFFIAFGVIFILFIFIILNAVWLKRKCSRIVYRLK